VAELIFQPRGCSSQLPSGRGSAKTRGGSGSSTAVGRGSGGSSVEDEGAGSTGPEDDGATVIVGVSDRPPDAAHAPTTASARSEIARAQPRFLARRPRGSEYIGIIYANAAAGRAFSSRTALDASCRFARP
jgi:hypothetical protein